MLTLWVADSIRGGYLGIESDLSKNEPKVSAEQRDAREEKNIKREFRARKKDLKRRQAAERSALRAEQDQKLQSLRYQPESYEEEWTESELTRDLSWRKLDNSATMYPIVTGEDMSNVYRICVTLTDEIRPDALQRALDIVLPKFPLFNSRLRQGIYWYYFEENGKEAPRVFREYTYPCQYIAQNRNRSYLFRVTYYGCRINLEVFHVLTDGMGAIQFLRELIYQYLRLAREELAGKPDVLSGDTSLDVSDSFLENYQKQMIHPYHFTRAYLLEDIRLSNGQLGVIQGYMPVRDLKAAAAEYNAGINAFVIAAVNWAIYTSYKNRMDYRKPLVTCVPVNLRPHFHSVTTKNFFVNISATFQPEHDHHTFEDVLEQIQSSLREKITKENLSAVLSSNVSTETSLISRVIPLLFKKPALKSIYQRSARSTTLTVTNLGEISVADEYREYIDHFDVLLTNSKGQNLKVALCSYNGIMSMNISSVLLSTAIQREFFRFFTAKGIPVSITSNGVYTKGK